MVILQVAMVVKVDVAACLQALAVIILLIR